MQGIIGWILLGLSLILGIAGAVLAAKVHHAFFWFGWIPCLILVGLYIWKSGDSKAAPSNEQTTENNQSS